MKLYIRILYICLSTLIVGCAANNTPAPVSQPSYQTSTHNIDLAKPDTRGDIRGTAGIVNRTSNSNRVALVIGNGAYQNEPKLTNPPHDATDVAKRLKELGFQVIFKTDLGFSAMRAVIAEFGHAATNAEAALFFYAGHAVQNHNQNYLLPVDITTNSIEDVVDRGVRLNYILKTLRRAKSMVNIVILDACRTPQFTNRFRGAARIRGEEAPSLGLSRITSQPDTMIVYATQPGNGAVDSVGGRNSPFTTGFLAALNGPDLTLGKVLISTTKRVKTLTKGYQVPYTDGPRTLDEFQFKVAANTTTPVSPTISIASPSNSTPTITSNPPPVSTAAADAEAARLAALETKRKQEEARIARLKQEQIAAKQAAAEAQAKAERLERQDRARKAAQAKEAARLAALEQKRRAEEARIARLQRQREEEERKAQVAKAEADRLARLNARRERTRREAARREAARRARAEAQARARRSRKPYEPEMVSIPGGCFQMGSPASEKERGSDEHQHKVCVKPFAIGKYEVTQSQWQAVMGNNPSYFTNCPKCPVEQVSWNDAQAYLRKLSARTGRKYRLPTEAEWEYAARAGTTTPFHTGNCISTNQANYDVNYPYSGCPNGQYRRKTIKVGSFSPNAWGLYDMSGNVWEWVQDWYSADYYTQSPRNDPAGPRDGSARVVRGGSWFYYADDVRPANRRRLKPGSRNFNLGLRVCEVIEPSR